MQERCRALIDLNAAENNYTYLRSRVHGAVKFLCVVKANAYGHGAVPLAHLWEDAGADMFAVATAEEALALHRNGLTAPILVLGYAPPHMAKLFCHADILPTIYSAEDALLWNAEAEKQGITLPCHIKINSGMNRLGIQPDDIDSIKAICAQKHLFPCGIYSHLARADTDDLYTRQQFDRFCTIARIVEGISGHVLTRHIANTEAILRHPEMHLDMVRAGIGLYGYSTCANTPLVPVMQLDTRIIQVYDLPRHACVGYGTGYKAKKNTRIAVLAIGYADGIRRDSGQRKTCMMIHGERCPIVGHVCMDMCMAEVGHVKHPIRVGDTATLFGYTPAHGANAMADILGTIPYELLTSISERVKRVYV